ncbi:hypothetical protein [Gemmiger sp.]|uniref:hypothetical protein n=1 Tax=Gemmiger sp. TaxID=2049027 RepID=UPI003A8F9B13
MSNSQYAFFGVLPVHLRRRRKSPAPQEIQRRRPAFTIGIINAIGHHWQWTTLVLFNALPFNILKGLVIGGLTMLTYKRLAPVLKGR